MRGGEASFTEVGDFIFPGYSYRAMKKSNTSPTAVSSSLDSIMYIIVKIKTLLIGVAIFVVILTVMITSEGTFTRADSASSRGMSAAATKEASSLHSSSSVPISFPFGSGDDKKMLEFIHCGASVKKGKMDEITEIILLHGAKYTKKDWVNSGIFDDLCLKGEGKFSVTALDLSVTATGEALRDVFNALSKKKVISGGPAIIVSPSASGKTIMDLITIAMKENDVTLGNYLKIWVPVASPAVLSANYDGKTFDFLKRQGIPILAINGNQDRMGKKVTEKLVELSGARGIEIEGSHAVYLDQPNKFVETVVQYVQGMDNEER